MSRKERIAVDTLLEKLGEPKASLSRRDPNEGGPLMVKVAKGRWQITPEGERRRSPMASAPYPLTMKNVLDGDIDFLADDIVALLYNGVFDTTDHFISDLSGTINDRSGPLSGKTTTAGVFDANNETVTTVPASTTDAVIIAADLGRIQRVRWSCIWS